ncbi:unnamed protein product [Lupinus luteus]|uniref:Uncharacterized protein n=1 Tax=Lupinus luteus TaxID=3873 RepID=A0AAV1WZV8_LUPLU
MSVNRLCPWQLHPLFVQLLGETNLNALRVLVGRAHRNTIKPVLEEIPQNRDDVQRKKFENADLGK